MSIRQQVVNLGDSSLDGNRSWLAWFVARLTYAGVAASIVIGGLGVAEISLYSLLAAALLLPTIVFLIGVWSPQRVLLFGTLLLVLTAGPWLLYVMNKRESMAGVDVVMGSILAFISSTTGACLELIDRVSRKRAPDLPRQPSPPIPDADESKLRPRAW